VPLRDFAAQKKEIKRRQRTNNTYRDIVKPDKMSRKTSFSDVDEVIDIKVKSSPFQLQKT